MSKSAVRRRRVRRRKAVAKQALALQVRQQGTERAAKALPAAIGRLVSAGPQLRPADERCRRKLAEVCVQTLVGLQTLSGASRRALTRCWILTPCSAVPPLTVCCMKTSISRVCQTSSLTKETGSLSWLRPFISQKLYICVKLAVSSPP